MAEEFKFELKPAEKKQIPALVGLWGPSGSGKTYSALLLARGMVGPKGKIALIDTENGRSQFYTDVAGPWLFMDFQPPFTPERYSAAFAACEKAGADVIVVDSMSHCWEGQGGVLDQADAVESNGLARWKKPKIGHKRMVNNLIRSPIPVIFCLRAKEGVKQVGSGKDMKIVPQGWMPIAEKGLVYEMTVDLHMTGGGKYDLSTSKTIPAALKDAIPEGGLVSIEMGQKIAAWAGSGATMDPEYIKLKRDGSDAALQGVDIYTDWKNKLEASQKEKIRTHHPEWSKIATAADAEKARAATENEAEPGI